MIHRQETALFNTNAIKNDMEKSRLLSQLITQSMGLFRTEKVTYNGGVVIFMHDKPKLEDSMTVWKISADGMKVSTDGMLTWNAGIDSEGNATVNLLETVGISFDWAKGGTLTLGGAENGHGKLAILDDKGKEKVIADNTGIKLKEGAELITDEGLYSTLNFSNNYLQPLGGWTTSFNTSENEIISVNVILPNNFKAERVILTLDTYGTAINSQDFTGYSRNIQLIKSEYMLYFNDPEQGFNPHIMSVALDESVTGELNGTKNGSKNDDVVRLVSGDLSSVLNDNLTVFTIISDIKPSPSGGGFSGYEYVGEAIANITVTGRIK